ncbi:MAG: GAF domain-containing protein, partial [Chloroflexota bacterium]
DAGMVFNPDLAAMLVALGVLFILSLTARYFSETLQSFAGRNQRNTDLLQATAEVGQITTQILSLDELFNRSVELIRDRFAYYHVQVFLVDEDRKFARLVASTGDIGQKLLARQHRLAVGSQSVIGRVTQVGEPVVARDTDRDPLHSRNELLPNTRSELALPIFDGDRIIGALDVQSTRSNAFKPADVQALQVMANQLGTAIRNALLFQSQAESVQENKRLFFESEANLREIQRLNRQLTQRAWSDYLTNRRIVSGITARPDEVQEDAAWTPIMAQASQRRRPVAAENGSSTLAVPIVLRGEVIGAIEIEPGEQGHNDNMIELAQTVAQRLAISLDNARLFEEAQQSTAQEQRLNEIATRYQAASTVDDLLEITLTELSDVLKASGGSIRLGGFRASENGSSGQTDDGGTGA